MFKFHRIGWIDSDGKEVSGWNCLIETEKQLSAYMQWFSQDIAQVWIDIKDSPKNKSGHCRTTRADVMKYLLEIKMEKEGTNRINLVEGISYIERILTKTLIDIYIQEGSVYVNSKGGCRYTCLRNDHKGVDEIIFETYTSKDLVFPTPKDEVEEVKITNWPLCPHFYLSINGRNIEVDGETKWKTIKGAEDAKRKFERRRKAAKKRMKNTTKKR